MLLFYLILLQIIIIYDELTDYGQNVTVPLDTVLSNFKLVSKVILIILI